MEVHKRVMFNSKDLKGAVVSVGVDGTWDYFGGSVKFVGDKGGTEFFINNVKEGKQLVANLLHVWDELEKAVARAEDALVIEKEKNAKAKKNKTKE